MSTITVSAGPARVQGELEVPEGARAVVVFAHGSGSSRFSPRNRFVARRLREAGLATFLMDLLTEDEERLDAVTCELRFDIPLLARRLELACEFLARSRQAKSLRQGYFGASTGAAAALIAAAAHPAEVFAVVCRGGRPDLAGEALPKVEAPTLLIVGGEDREVLALNRQAAARMRCERKVEVVAGATHLFEEPGALERAAQLAADWFSAQHAGS